ncbi:hypothetical protein F3Y22_tig00110223pilonHSYRG00298 [Hibiscus syriacus]|uniref:Uncharacterized protein n=1 Tax=Hibiscus syriacus TaxID=106335 RepID=A0A6A3BDL2_HIBSY|nr:hypothetical protein F3Y22_tig00110223pilonHSYRG00298 [Hibiscus syriacus]
MALYPSRLLGRTGPMRKVWAAAARTSVWKQQRSNGGVEAAGAGNDTNPVSLGLGLSHPDGGGGGGCRKRRRGGERIFKFKSFGENSCPVEFDGPFRDNVKAMVEYGHLEMNLCNDGVLCCTGWGNHIICNKKYHFLLPSKDSVAACFNCDETSSDESNPEKAYGYPWFGRWGYKFGRGCYGVNQPIYQKAIEAIQGIPLCLLNHHLSISNNDVSVIFSRWSSSKKSRVQAGFKARRDAARAYIGDTGLLDFVLKSLGNHIVGNYLILKDQMPTMSTRVLSAIPMATRIILDTKFLIKEYTEEQLPIQDNSFKLFCTVALRNNEGINEGEVEKSFREVYWRLRSFVMEAVANMSVKGSDLVVGSIETGQKLVFIGSNCDQMGSEDSSGTGTVDCLCGAKEDDSGRLISCDIYEIWQHTRCVRIPNNDEIPHVFLCKQCEEKIVFLYSSLL